MNTERPVDEEPKYKRSRYCDKPLNRRGDEEETIQTENMPNSIRLKEKFEKFGERTSPNLKGAR